MMTENGRKVLGPALVCTIQSSEDCGDRVAASNSLRAKRSGILPTANKASGPRIRATRFKVCWSTASSRRGSSISYSTRSPCLQDRLMDRNFPGSTGESIRLPLTETYVWAPAQDGTRKNTVKVSWRGSLNSNWVVFALG